MDLVNILNEAIARLPRGDHSAGLTAIMRHISIAIRHFERRGDRDADSFTDAIYRTNQAYEGSLKEAYRVLAGKDPVGETPNQIEKYLEENQIIRPRVLTQLSRYRQDYRNPSTHDYKLDFDEDEALLAIVSVLAFAKLLLDQISEKLAFNSAASAPPPAKVANVDLGDSDTFFYIVTDLALSHTNDSDPELTDSEFDGALAGKLSSIGVELLLDKSFFFDEAEFIWDLFIEHKGNYFPIEIRAVSGNYDANRGYGVMMLFEGLKASGYKSGLAIHRGRGKSRHHLYKSELEDISIYIISQWSINEVERTDPRIRGTVTQIR